MASPVTPGLVRAEFRCTWNGQLVENVMFFDFGASTYSQGDLEDLGAVLADFAADMVPLQGPTCIQREFYIEGYQGEGSMSHTEGLGSTPGTASGDGLPNNCGLCVSFRTGLTGRSRRGRNYTIGMTESHQAAGVVNSTYRNAVLAAYSALAANLAANTDWVHNIASFFSNGEPRLQALKTPVTAYQVVDDFVDSQRRRLPGRGR